MEQSDGDVAVGTDAITVESIVIALFTLVFAMLPSTWNYFWIFYLSLGGVLLMMLFRVMAGEADEPSLSAIKSSLRWSSTLLQIALLGVLSSISLFVSTFVEMYPPIVLFTSFAFVLPISVALVDELWLGEYTKTWVDIIYQQTSDGPFGELIRSAADFGREQVEALKRDKVTPTPRTNLIAFLFGVALLALLSIVTIPIWLVLAGFLGNWRTAILVVISLLLLRDITRYVYIRYGAAQSFNELKLPLRWGLTLTAAKGILVLGALGYDLTAIL